MNENIHDIEGLFHDAIEPHEELPPDAVWDKINLTLDKSSLLAAHSKYKKLKRFSVGLLLFTAGILLFEMTKKPFEANHQDAGGLNMFNKTLLPAEHDALRNPPAITERNTGRVKKNIQPAISSPEQTDPLTQSANSRTNHPSGPSARPKTEIAPDNKAGDENANIPSVRQNITVPVLIRHLPAEKNLTISPAPVSEGASIGSSPITGSRASLQKNLSSGRGDLVSSEKHTHQLKAKKQYNRIPPDQPSLNHPAKAASNRPRPLAPTNAVNDDRTLPGSVVEPLDPGHTFFQLSLPGSAQPGIVNRAVSKPAVSKPKTKFQFSLSPYYAPYFYFDNVAEGEQHSPGGSRNDADRIKHDENDLHAYSLGINIQVAIKKRWGLQSGIGYTSRNEGIDAKKIYAVTDNSGSVKYRFDFSSGYVYLLPNNAGSPVVGDSTTTSASNHHLQYLSIPLALNYTLLKGRFNVIPSLGAAVNILLKDELQTGLVTGGTTDRQRITSVMGLKKMYVQSITGITLQYNVGKRISLSLTPAVNFALGTISTNARVKSYPNAFSLAGGLRFYF